MSKKPTITNWASINKASGVAMSNRHMPSRAIWLRISSRGEPIALLIEAQFVMVGFLDIPKGTLPELYWPAILPLRFLLVNILTWILLAIVILLAVWLPASKAAEMEPAEALRYDG